MAQGKNYTPNISGPFVSALPSTVSPSATLSGIGSPEGACPGVPGQKYVDIATGNLYLKIGGTQKLGWDLVGKALAETVSMGGSMFSKDYSGGTPTDTPPSGIGVAIDTSNGRVWWYYGGQWN